MRILAFMPGVKQGAPPSLAPAMIPPMHRVPTTWSSRGQIMGQPGTQGIPIKGPQGLAENLSSLANAGQFTSAHAPNVFFPSLYYIVKEREKCPVSVFSDNQMPVPAGRPANIISASPYRQRLGGQRQVVQPLVVQSWPGMYTNRASAK